MLNPSKKGLVSYVNTVDIRGYKRVNLFSAACGIAYGKDYEAEFFGKDMKASIQLRNQLFFKKVGMACSFDDAIYEVLVNYFQQSGLAREAFEAMDDLSCSDENFEKALQRIRENSFSPVPEMNDMLEDVVEVEEANVAPTVQNVSELKEVTEVTETEKEVPVIEQTTMVEEIASEQPRIEVPSFENTYITENIPIVEESKTVKPDVLAADILEEARNARVVEQPSTELDYILLFKDKITVEVDNFKLLPNSNTAAELLNKVKELLPEMAVVDIVYNKSILHALLIEFKGAASMLSSFRVLALGLSTRV